MANKSLYSDRRFACKTDAKRRTLRNHTDTPAEGRVVPAIAPPRGPSGPRETVAARVRRGQGAGKARANADQQLCLPLPPYAFSAV